MRAITTTTQIGALLASRRKHLDLSQSDVASRIGLSQNRLSVLESDPDSMTIKQLFALLGTLGLEMSIAERKAQKSQEP